MKEDKERFSEYYVDYKFIQEFLERQFNTEIDDYLEKYMGRRDEDYLPEIGYSIESEPSISFLQKHGLSPESLMTQATRFLEFLRENWQRLVWDCSTDKTAPETWIHAAVQEWAGEYKDAVVSSIEHLDDEETDLLLNALFSPQAVYSVMLTDEGWTDGFSEQPHYFTRAWSAGIEPYQLLPSGSGHGDSLTNAAHQAAWHVIHCVIQAGLELFFTEGPGQHLTYANPRQQQLI